MDSNQETSGRSTELELLEFAVGDLVYGINVAKVREIINWRPGTPGPHTHPSIEGIFMPRDTMITAVDLRNCLGRGNSKPGGLFIVTNFNHLNLAFHVDAVKGIQRTSWQDIIKPNATITDSDARVSTGFIKHDNMLVVILDFERLIAEVNPETSLKISEIDRLGVRKRSQVPILIAEDSTLLNKLLVDSLTRAGYTKLIHTENGKQAFDEIKKYLNEGTLYDHIRLVITDIEMPEMDGHHLIKLIKGDSRTSYIPTVIFSSLVNDDMRRKGEAIGADAQLSKPDIGELVRIIDDLVAKYNLEAKELPAE